MNRQTKIGFLMIGAAFILTAGLYINIVPLTLAHLLVAVIMGWMAYIHVQKGELVSTLGVSSLSGVFLTLVLSSVTPFSFYPLTVLLLAIAGLGAIHNIVTGLRG